MIHTLVSVPLAFVVNIVVARAIGVVDYGHLAFLSTVMDVMAGVISLGVGAGLIQFASKAHAAGRTGEVQQLLSKSQGFRLLIDLPIMSLVVLGLAHTQPWILAVAIIFGVVAPAALSGAPACLSIENKTAAGAKNAMVINLLTQVAVLLAVFTVGQADAIWAARIAMSGAAAALAMLWISPAYRRAVLRPRLPQDFPPGFWAFALPTGAASVLGTLVVSRTEVVALTWLGQPAAAGIFALAFGLAVHLFSPAQALIGPLIPAISGLAEVDPEAIEPAFRRTMRGTSTIVAVMIAGAVPLFAGLLIPLYGAQYAEAVPIFVALGIGAGLLVMGGPMMAFVQARLNGRAVLRANVVALALDIVLVLALIPPFGAWGAAIANIAAALTRMLLLAAPELTALGLRWTEFGRLVLPALLGAAACIGASAVAHLASPHPAVQSALGATLGAACLTASLVLLRSGLSQEDAAAIRRAYPAQLDRLAGPLLKLITHAR